MIITIPFKTPTVNNLYGKTFKHNGLYLKPEAKKIKEHIHDLIKLLPSQDFVDKKLKVIVDVYENWLTKKGEVKRKDIANREKFIIDSVFECLGLDDKYIYEMILRKIQSENEMAMIQIEVIK